jgi:hypothetical protein
MTELTRRNILTSIGTLGLGAAAGTVGGESVSDSAIADDLQLDDPAGNLDAYIKLRGDLTDSPVYDIVRGHVFGLVPGQAARPLFKMIGAQRGVYSRQSSLEFHMESRYVGILLDWETEQPLQDWLNPYNQKRCEVPATRYGPSTTRLLTDSMVPANAGPETPPRSKRQWFIIGGVLHLMDQIVSPVTPALRPDADLMTFSGDVRQVADPRVTRVPAQLSFTAVESWREWMQMQQPGSLWWHVSGVKLRSPDDYPGELLPELRRLDPEFFTG